MKKYIEFGIGNTWCVRTEIEDDDGAETEQMEAQPESFAGKAHETHRRTEGIPGPQCSGNSQAHGVNFKALLETSVPQGMIAGTCSSVEMHRLQ